MTLRWIEMHSCEFTSSVCGRLVEGFHGVYRVRSQLLAARRVEAQVVRGLWEVEGPQSALTHIIARGDEALAVDFLKAICPVGFPRVAPPRSGGLSDMKSNIDWVELLCDILKGLLRSRFEE